MNSATAAGQSVTISPTPFQVVLDNAGKIVSGGCVWTYTAGTTTPATTYSNNAGSTNSNPIIADSAGRFTAFLTTGASYKFVYESACTPPAHGTVYRTADNISATPATSAGVDVTGTAGEAITAGQAVYLSDGSGSKNAGQWYKADKSTVYSATLPEVGIATTNIAQASSGTIRISGSITGLSSLAVGSPYYVGAAGAITATAPANARFVGLADSATSLIVSANPSIFSVPFVDDFRLSLTTATCVTTGDVTAATTIFLTPCNGNRLTLFDSAGNPTVYTTAEISVAVPNTTSTMYDVFAFASSGTPALEALAWTSDTARATALVRTSGRWTKSGDSTRLYLGSFRTTGVSGQTEDSASKRHLWNFYNRVMRTLRKADATATWTYTTATWRQANGAAANQVDVIIGIAEAPLHLSVTGYATNAGAAQTNLGIGEDSTTVPSTNQAGGFATTVATTTNNAPHADLDIYPAIGRHFYAWLEFSTAVGTTTWYGTNASIQSGLTGLIPG